MHKDRKNGSRMDGSQLKERRMINEHQYNGNKARKLRSYKTKENRPQEPDPRDPRHQTNDGQRDNRGAAGQGLYQILRPQLRGPSTH